MSAVVKNITPSYPTLIPVLFGAAAELVSMREQRGQYVKKGGDGYFTNRHIKVWSTYFLLKALTRSSVLHNWQQQKDYLYAYLQLNDNTFRWHLKEMQRLQLITSYHSACDRRRNDNNIVLCSYKAAANILGITYQGTKLIEYDCKKHTGKQLFQYFLRAEEFKEKIDTQLEALRYHCDNNPTLKSTLTMLLVKEGNDSLRLDNDPVYFQQRLLQLQIRMFADGSNLLDIVMQRRADVNRGVKKIQEHHGYKSAQSVSYLKKRMVKHGIISCTKRCIESKNRSRLYVPDIEKGKRDGYKWISRPIVPGGKDEGVTAWFLTDQISFHFKTTENAEKKEKNIAA